MRNAIFTIVVVGLTPLTIQADELISKEQVHEWRTALEDGNASTVYDVLYQMSLYLPPLPEHARVFLLETLERYNEIRNALQRNPSEVDWGARGRPDYDTNMELEDEFVALAGRQEDARFAPFMASWLHHGSKSIDGLVAIGAGAVEATVKALYHDNNWHYQYYAINTFKKMFKEEILSLKEGKEWEQIKKGLLHVVRNGRAQETALEALSYFSDSADRHMFAILDSVSRHSPRLRERNKAWNVIKVIPEASEWFAEIEYPRLQQLEDWERMSVPMDFWVAFTLIDSLNTLPQEQWPEPYRQLLLKITNHYIDSARSHDLRYSVFKSSAIDTVRSRALYAMIVEQADERLVTFLEEFGVWLDNSSEQVTESITKILLQHQFPNRQQTLIKMLRTGIVHHGLLTSAERRNQIEEALLQAARSSNDATRAQIVGLFIYYGGEEIMTLLKELIMNDPEVAVREAAVRTYYFLEQGYCPY